MNRTHAIEAVNAAEGAYRTSWSAADRPPWHARFGEWLASARAHRVVCLLLGLWVVNAFDIALTVLAHQAGVLHEENPIAAKLLHTPSGLAIYKLALVAFASTVLYLNRRKLIAEITAAGMLVIYGIVAVQWRLCYEVYAITFNYRLVLGEQNAVELGYFNLTR